MNNESFVVLEDLGYIRPNHDQLFPDLFALLRLIGADKLMKQDLSFGLGKFGPKRIRHEGHGSLHH
ncbi:hypothetical protein SDC9_172247 [bioreactor metagenome]|uniref:Uncharacterized protein n=1 Tax=bioreactor metagenome TaxID=1076179 RepID=A0A645GFN2_9ZZZZ